MEVVRHLTLLPSEPTAAIAPSADLVCWSRLGSAYRAADLDQAVAEQRLLDLRGLLRPYEDLALFRAQMAEWPGRGELRPWQLCQQEWVDANDACRREILERLKLGGPLPASELPDTCVVPWRSTGWTNNRNVLQLLGLMAMRGEAAVAGRRGRERLWDLGERVYPDDPGISSEAARRIRDERRLRALGIARARAPEAGIEPDGVADAGEPALVVDVPGAWRVDPAYLDQPFEGRAALLSPFDRLVYDRRRMTDLFQFEYQLEMYKPPAARRWGYYALPVLYGDRLVGKLDARVDRRAGVLAVDTLHADVELDRAALAAVDAEIEDLASWLGLAVARTSP